MGVKICELSGRRVQGEVQLQDIDPRLAEHAELTAVGVFLNQLSQFFLRHGT